MKIAKMSDVLHNVAENGLRTFNNCCLLCCSTDGIFSNINLRKFAPVRVLLEEILEVQFNQNEAKSKLLCHKCIFKLKVQKEFKAVQVATITNTKLCIICGEEGHTDLKTTNPVVKNKFNLWNKETKVKQKAGSILCTTCFYKLELLDELKAFASTNLAGNEICDSTFEHDLTNGFPTNNKKLMSVKHMVKAGLVKVERSIYKDSKMYVQIVKVNIVTNTENKGDVLTLSPIKKPVKKDPIRNTKQNANKWKVKVNAVPKRQQRKQKTATVRNKTKDEDTDAIVSKPLTPKRRSAKKIQKQPKDEDSSNSDENLNSITVHKDDVNNHANFKIPVIILKREDAVKTTNNRQSSRKRTLKHINEAKVEENDVKEKVAKTLVVNGLGDKESSELKENIPEEIPNGADTTQKNSEENVDSDPKMEESINDEDAAVVVRIEVDNLESLPTPPSPSSESSSLEEVMNVEENLPILPANEKENLPTNEKEKLPINEKEVLPDEGKENLPDEGKENLPDEGKENLPDEERENLSDEERENLSDEKENLSDEEKENLPAGEKEDLPAGEKEDLPTDEKEDLPTDKTEDLPTNEKENHKEEEIIIIEESTDIVESKTINSIEDDDVVLPKFGTDDSESSDTEKLAKDLMGESDSQESSELAATQVYELENESEDGKDGTSIEIISDDETKSDEKIESVKEDDAESEDELALIANHINSDLGVLNIDDKIAEPVQECSDMDKQVNEDTTEVTQEQKDKEAEKNNDIFV